MIAVRDQHHMRPDEYLEWEATQPVRHEYLHGIAYAMTGGTLAHNTVAINLTTLLKEPVRKQGCKLFMADAKVQLPATDQSYFYPDVMVTCHPEDKQATKFIQHPCLVIEVLSPATEAYDRGDKFGHYRTLVSLQEYVLISSARMSVEVFRLNERGKWELTPYNPGDALQLTSVGFECPLESLYEDLEL